MLWFEPMLLAPKECWIVGTIGTVPVLTIGGWATFGWTTTGYGFTGGATTFFLLPQQDISNII